MMLAPFLTPAIEDMEEFLEYAWTTGLLDERFGDTDPEDEDEALELLWNAVFLGLVAPDEDVPGVLVSECPICGLPETGVHLACDLADTWGRAFHPTARFAPSETGSPA